MCRYMCTHARSLNKERWCLMFSLQAHNNWLISTFPVSNKVLSHSSSTLNFMFLNLCAANIILLTQSQMNYSSGQYLLLLSKNLFYVSSKIFATFLYTCVVLARLVYYIYLQLSLSIVSVLIQLQCPVLQFWICWYFTILTLQVDFNCKTQT